MAWCSFKNAPTRRSGKPGKQPQLPQRPCWIQPLRRQLLECLQQLRLVARSGKWVNSDMVGEVEGGRVNPQRPAQSPPGPVQALPKARDQVQPRLQVAPNVFDPDARLVVEQAGAVEDGERADIARPAEVIPLEQEDVRCAQTF